MSYFKYNVNLTEGQKEKLIRAYQKHSPITLRLNTTQLTGNDTLILTQRQINKIAKSKKNSTGTDLKISSTQIKQQTGGNILSAIASMALPYATKAIAPLASGALSGLASIGVNKLLGNGLFAVPQDKVDKLIEYQSYLTTHQKKQIVNALQNGSGCNLKLTKKQQVGGFLGSLLASLAIPMVIKAISGKGLQVEASKYAKGLQVEGPPPFYGQWPSTQGYGKKPRKKKTLE